MGRLNRSFFARPADLLAPDLLGKFLVRQTPGGGRKEGMITEVEAYLGVEDRACHSFGGRRSARNEPMYGPPGHAYVYFTYGMHWMLNVVCAALGDPQAVLLRALDWVSGPARLTKALQIDRSFNEENLLRSRQLWIEDRGERVSQKEIKIAPRIGIGYAKEWKDKPLRFILQNPSIRRPPSPLSYSTVS